MESVTDPSTNHGVGVEAEQRILVVDDDKDFADSLEEVLVAHNYNVKTAYNLDSAEQIIKQFNPQVMLLDVRMGNRSGVDLLDLLSNQYPGIICIMVTAFADIDTAVNALRHGAYDYLRKPVQPELLLAVLERSFDKRSLEQEKLHAEEALRISEERFRSLITNIPGAIYRCTFDGNFVMHYISEVIEDICGYPASDIIANKIKSYQSIIHPDDISFFQNGILKGVKKHDPYILEYRIIHKDGSTRWVHDKGRPIFDEEGKLRWLDGGIFDITDAHELSEQLSYQATHDALTDMVNRREFESRLQRVLDSSLTQQSDHALIYLDLDQFKVINDTCGHIAGDELLRQLSAVLKQHIRQRDTLARLGGDEFGVLIEHCTLEHAKRVADALRMTVTDFRFIWEERSFSIGVSIGLVPIIPHAFSSITSVLKEADGACYAAKEAGRNRTHVYHVDDVDLARRHGEMQWVARINTALEENRFFLYSQPIISIAQPNFKGTHFELLLRMEEDGNIILPGNFLPAAEHYNLITKLDRWVIETSFEFLSRNSQYLVELYLCDINLSGHSLSSKEFLGFVIDAFKQSKISPEKICFEITETAVIANMSSAIHFIKTLKNLGCKFALDDFGRGLSSFAYLKTLPVDYLKIDGIFVKDICDDPIYFAMVKSINEIGQVMNKKTVAEFVESDEILNKLSAIGVDYVQGYSIGRPRPIEESLLVAIV